MVAREEIKHGVFLVSCRNFMFDRGLMGRRGSNVSQRVRDRDEGTRSGSDKVGLLMSRRQWGAEGIDAKLDSDQTT